MKAEQEKESIKEIISSKTDLVKTVTNELEYENKLKNDLDACLNYFDTPSDQLDLEFFNKVKTAHNEFKQIEAQEELKDLREALFNKNKNDRITDTKHNELEMSFREDTLLNKFILKKNSQYNMLSKEEAAKYEFIDEDGELYNNMPDYDPDEETDLPSRKYKSSREFDCQTIVSTYSTTDNLPKFYKIDKVEEMVQLQNEKDKIREETKLSRINESMMSINSIKSTIKDAQGLMSIKRDRDEDPEVRKRRKEAIKLLKRENREFKKQVKEEYSKGHLDIMKNKDNLHKVGCHEV